jgi:hypothetical protein
VFSKDLGPCIPNGRIQAEHIDGGGRIALLREGESPVLPGEGKEEEGPESLGGSFFYHLELGDHNLAPFTCELGGGALDARWGAVPDYP